MSREIVLTDGKITQVNEEDFAYLSYWSWSTGGRNKSYVQRTETQPKRVTIFMHKVVAARSGLNVSGIIDHRDRNTLNNQRENLREATDSQNQGNSDTPVNNTSGYKGVSYKKAIRRFQAYIRIGGKLKHLGYFSTPVQAAVAYNLAAKYHFGDFAVLNKV